MIDFDRIKVSLQEWIVRSSILEDSKVVFSEQSSPRPNKPYMTMKVSSIVDIGQDDARLPIDDEGNAEFIGNKEFTLSIQSFGDSALSMLSTIRDSLNSPDELQRLRDEGVIFVDQLLFDDISDLLETIWEERGQLDLLLRATSISSHQVGIIERVYLGSTYNEVENNIAIQIPDAIAGTLLSINDSIISIDSDKITLL